jgi:NAD(P)-dependent dehydrogenase (short-subunit alcohol dehydrogenase family)
MSGKVWFVTGASRGFGRIWATAALARGDKVAATARDIGSLADVAEAYPDSALPLQLDVTDRDAVDHAVAQAHRHFGRLDVVVNNAGYGFLGAVEEVSEADVQALLDTNFFGALRVTQAVLPILRDQGNGHIVSVSSLAGVVGEPALGLYNASKWALEGMMEALSLEVEDFGVKVTLIEPGPYATDFSTQSSLQFATPNAAYDGVRQTLRATYGPEDIGDPHATSEALFDVVDSPQPPLRLILGLTALRHTRTRYAERLATWEAWAPVSERAHGSPST